MLRLMLCLSWDSCRRNSEWTARNSWNCGCGKSVREGAKRSDEMGSAHKLDVDEWLVSAVMSMYLAAWTVLSVPWTVARPLLDSLQDRQSSARVWAVSQRGHAMCVDTAGDSTVTVSTTVAMPQTGERWLACWKYVALWILLARQNNISVKSATAVTPREAKLHEGSSLLKGN